MTDINPAATATTATSTATASASTGASSSSNSAVSAATIGEDFDTFLQLLTAQIRNQDPLAPMDSTQFVEQLATFSSLEQQVETNKTLESIASMIGNLVTSDGRTWVSTIMRRRVAKSVMVWLTCRSLTGFCHNGTAPATAHRGKTPRGWPNA